MRAQHILPTVAALALTSAAAYAQSTKQPETPVTLVGCIQREADYRKTHDLDKGAGKTGIGLGRGDEYVLINASRGTTASPNIDCSFQGSTEAYELTGRQEHDLKPYVGKVVQITGTMKQAKTKPLASGEQAPTGGFDPLKKDLRLFEVEVASFQPAANAAVAAAQPPAATAQRRVPRTRPRQWCVRPNRVSQASRTRRRGRSHARTPSCRGRPARFRSPAWAACSRWLVRSACGSSGVPKKQGDPEGTSRPRS
jgi:hypothetical protein